MSLLLLTGFPVASADSSSPSRFPVTLAAEPQYHLGEPITLTFGLRNDSGHDYSMLVWDTPLENLDREVLDYVRVQHDGHDLPYEGRVFKRAEPDESAYRLIRAGEQVREQIDLTTAFAFTQPGEYTVTLDTQVRDAVPSSSPPAATGRQFNRVALAPVAVSFQVLPGGTARSTGAEIARQHTGVSPQIDFIGGTPEQRQQVTQAASDAEAYVRDARSSLAQAPSSTRYTTWFGTYSDGRHQIVRSHFDNIAGDSYNSTYDLVTCTTEGVYAYVYPDSPGMVYLCPQFWSAPMTGTDSKAGTLVHEQSHFTVNGGTGDYAYGQSACQSLAQNNPNTAVMNADSHEYFAENNPPL